jgi:hypothetical protein
MGANLRAGSSPILVHDGQVLRQLCSSSTTTAFRLGLYLRSPEEGEAVYFWDMIRLGSCNYVDMDIDG